MFVLGHPGQGRHGLPLASRGDNRYLVVGEQVDFCFIDFRILGYMNEALIFGNADVGLHAFSAEQDFSIVFHRQADYLLDSRDIGGENRHDQSPIAGLEEFLESPFHVTFTKGKTLSFHIGGI